MEFEEFHSTDCSNSRLRRRPFHSGRSIRWPALCIPFAQGDRNGAKRSGWCMGDTAPPLRQAALPDFRPIFTCATPGTLAWFQPENRTASLTFTPRVRSLAGLEAFLRVGPLSAQESDDAVRGNETGRAKTARRRRRLAFPRPLIRSALSLSGPKR